jgi:hypothetical protein
MKPRLFTMPAEEYRKIDAVTQSEVRNYLQSPAYWNAARQYPQPPTESMLLGAYFDAKLTGDGLERFVVQTWDGRTKEGKALAEQYADKHVISQRNAADIDRWVASVMASDAAKIIREADKQVCAAGQINGVLCVGRADLLVMNGAEVVTGGQIYDLKLLADASPDAMSRAVTDGYDIQAAMYCALFSQACGNAFLDWSFTLIAQEKHPYPATADFTGLYTISEPDKLKALAQIEKTVVDIANAKAFGHVGYGAHTITARYPRVLK